MTNANYKETIDFLYSRLPMFSRIGASAIKKDLTNTKILCEKLGHPESGFKTIHVAGTNGKGSTSHMLASIFQTAGYKTGLYTSPHLHDFRERIRINGEMVREDFVVDFTEKVTPLIDEIEPSFFEITVVMAFEYFAEEEIDIAIIETGLGGRLDSTNVIVPELSVITNIGWDHMNILGDSLAKIASEKAGIIKKGIPVVIGETQSETKNVFIEKASDMNAPIVFADQQRFVNGWTNNRGFLTAEIADHHHQDHQKYDLDLTGIYQLKNLVTVLEVVSQMQKRGWTIVSEDVKTALQNVMRLTGLHGRWEVIHHKPMVVLDVGHNEDGMKQIMNQVTLTDHHHLHIIIGMVKDKEVDKVLKLLPQNAKYYYTHADIPRALDAERLKDKAIQNGLEGEIYPDVNTALQDAIIASTPDDLILVCGSVFLVGEVHRI